MQPIEVCIPIAVAAFSESILPPLQELRGAKHQYEANLAKFNRPRTNTRRCTLTAAKIS